MDYGKALRWAPWLLLGPLTGPLALGCISAWRAERPGMAAIYALGVAEVWLGLPTILTHELLWIAAWRGG